MMKRSGFTLIELIVIIVLITAAGAIAIPAFTVWLPNYRLRAAANDLYTNLNLAKSGAVRDHTTWAVRFDPGNNQYALLSGEGASSGWTDGDEIVEKTVDLSEYGSGVAFGHGNATSAIGGGFGDDVTYAVPENNVAAFNSRGTCSPGYVYLQNNENSTFAVGSLSCGAVRMRRWNGGAWE
jgi:type II secretory pathway pseudopilin PulG